jgi:putative FmdB family regulatory protein
LTIQQCGVNEIEQQRNETIPVYVFECEACFAQLEVQQSIAKPLPNRRKCPACKKNKLQRLIFVPHFYNKPGDSQISVGLLADRNTQRFSEEHKEAINKKHGVKRVKEPKEKNFWDVPKKTLQKIATLDGQAKKKYIETGVI